MYSVIVVDDEILVRAGIRALIEWDKNGFYYAGDYPDGEEALKAIENDPPDIILTDIIMPNLDGLELIKTVKERFPAIRVIALSCHNEYEYLRRAMKLGADDYVLKASVRPAELLELLQETAQKLDKTRMETAGVHLDKQDGPSARRTLLQTLLMENSFGQPQDFVCRSDYLCLLRLRGGTSEVAGEQSGKQTFCNFAELQIKKWTDGIVCRLEAKSFAVLLSFGEPQEDEQLLLIGQDLLTAVKRFLNIDCDMGISEICKEAASLRHAREQAERVLAYAFYTKEQGIFLHRGFLFPTPKRRLMVSLLTDFQRAVALLDFEQMRTWIGVTFPLFCAQRADPAECRELFLEMALALRSRIKQLEEDSGIKFQQSGALYRQVDALDTIYEVWDWFGAQTELLEQYVRENAIRTTRNEIRCLAEYVETHYMDSISLQDAARLVNMNEVYLSTLFKKEMQTSFTAYLNQRRLEKAAEYLRSTDLPNYVIAEKVGYENFNYFSRIFKKVMGTAPSEYRLRFQKK